jgi:thymidylate synthase (FAD)
MINVTLVSCTPNPEKTVAAAAKLCYARRTFKASGASQPTTKRKLRLNASEIGHESPIEH